MLRLLVAAVGLVQLLFPDLVVELYTRLAYEGPAAFRVRGWVRPAMRLEGLVLLYFALRGFEDADEASAEDQASFANANVPLMFSM